MWLSRSFLLLIVGLGFWFGVLGYTRGYSLGLSLTPKVALTLIL